jgi:hypothetical protein
VTHLLDFARVIIELAGHEEAFAGSGTHPDQQVIVPLSG